LTERETYVSVCCLQDESSLKVYKTTNALLKHAGDAHGKEAVIVGGGSGGAPSADKKNRAEGLFDEFWDYLENQFAN
jgi:hypothetical protein